MSFITAITSPRAQRAALWYDDHIHSWALIYLLLSMIGLLISQLTFLHLSTLAYDLATILIPLFWLSALWVGTLLVTITTYSPSNSTPPQ